MKQSFAAVAVLASAFSTAQAADSIVFTKLLDTAVPVTKQHSATYNPAADKYLIGGPTDIKILNGTTGAVEGTLALGSIVPGGLGFFAVTADEAGAIYAFEHGTSGGNMDIWKWNSVADTAPVKIVDTAAFARVGATAGSGSNVTVAFTGSANDGPVQFFTTTDGTNFALNPSPAPDLDAKSALAINSDATVAYTVGDTGAAKPINKFVKTSGTWSATPDAAFAAKKADNVTALTGGGPMAYDTKANVLFIISSSDQRDTIYALDGTTGAHLGNAQVTTIVNGTTGYNGGYAVGNGDTGTVWLAGRNTGGDTEAAVWKFTYDVVYNSSVSDWSIY